jgi:hypothetical protein
MSIDSISETARTIVQSKGGHFEHFPGHGHAGQTDKGRKKYHEVEAAFLHIPYPHM